MSRSNCAVRSAAKRVVLHRQAGLVVQLERAVVEVDRAHARPRAVHGQRLGVEHGRAVLVKLDSRLQQLVVDRPARGPDDALVDVRARHQHPYGHAALGRVHERLQKRGTRHEVGRGQVQRPLGRRDGQVGQRLGVGVAHARAGARDLHRNAVVERLDVGQVALPAEHLAGGLDPVLGERRPASRAPPGPRRARGCRASGLDPGRCRSTPRRCRRLRSCQPSRRRSATCGGCGSRAGARHRASAAGSGARAPPRPPSGRADRGPSSRRPARRSAR